MVTSTPSLCSKCWISPTSIRPEPRPRQRHAAVQISSRRQWTHRTPAFRHGRTVIVAVHAVEHEPQPLLVSLQVLGELLEVQQTVVVDVALEDDLRGGSKFQRQSGLGAGRRGSRRMEQVGMANAHSGSFLVRQGEIFSDADGMARGTVFCGGRGSGGEVGVHRESATGTQVSGGEDRM